MASIKFDHNTLQKAKSKIGVYGNSRPASLKVTITSIVEAAFREYGSEHKVPHTKVTQYWEQFNKVLQRYL